MIDNKNWIWLDEKVHPDTFKTATWFSKNHKDLPCKFVEFTKTVELNKNAKKIEIEISADVKYFLFVNGKFLGLGPITPGGDYDCPDPMPEHYFSTHESALSGKTVQVRVVVQTMPIVQCDMTQGRNGLNVCCNISLEDGKSVKLFTDKTWKCRIINQIKSDTEFDFTLPSNEFENAKEIDSVWSLYPSEIENVALDLLTPKGAKTIVVKNGCEVKKHFELDKIYSGYYTFKIKAQGPFTLTLYDYEKDEYAKEKKVEIKGDKDLFFKSITLTSAGAFDIVVKSLSGKVIVKDIKFVFAHYPILDLGSFKCSDKELNKVYALGRHALKICRQSIELDSPKHQENLQCAGDYHIASLMNYYSDGDTKLSRFDIIRIARYLVASKGYMFHTTYGLIYVQMIYEYFMHSGDKDLLYLVKDALVNLFSVHEKTVGKSGLIEDPENYMFIDWLDVDGYSMHHPPKALGQTVLNAFYYKALTCGAKIFALIGDSALEKDCLDKASKVKTSFVEFYDAEKGLYFDGKLDKDTPTTWKPENATKKYYSWHSNVLAVLYGLANGNEVGIMEKVLKDDTLIKPQPYFMHFVLEAIDSSGLFEKYGLKELSKWKYMTEFNKGLVEGWVNCKDYGYDYSHVWAGTPTYQLPSKISGLKILKAGFEEITLSPKLCGLKKAKIDIPSPKGVIKIRLKEGKKPKIKVPNGIKYKII